MNPLTQQGIAALKLGDRTAARQLLAAAIKQDARDVTAWLWLAGAMDKEEEQIDCLRFVLKIDPQNQAAARGLAQLQEHRSAPQAPTPAAPQVAPEPALPPRQVEPEPEPAPPPLPAEPLPRPPASAPTSQPAIESLRESLQPFEEPEPAPVEEPLVAQPDAFIEDSTPASQNTFDIMQESAQFVAEPLPSPAAVEPEPILSRLPFRRRKARPAEEETARTIFRARPSLVPQLICFWLFLFGAFGMAALLSEAGATGLILAAGVGLLLELVVLYAVLRGLAERYELTNQQLTLRFHGKRARIPIAHVYHAEPAQSFFQRMLGIGNVEIDTAVGGQLTHLRMRNIPQHRQRTDQIMHLVNDHEST